MYFIYYSRVVIIFFSTGFYKSAFSTYSLGKTRSFFLLVFFFFCLCIFGFQFLFLLIVLN